LAVLDENIRYPPFLFLLQMAYLDVAAGAAAAEEEDVAPAFVPSLIFFNFLILLVLSCFLTDSVALPVVLVVAADAVGVVFVLFCVAVWLCAKAEPAKLSAVKTPISSLNMLEDLRIRSIEFDCE
jgi:hypothetical protein